MNKKKILIILRTAFASRTAHHVLSLLLTGIMLGGIGLTLRSDIEDIKLYVQSVLEKDPNYKNLQESVSENMVRGEINIESKFEEDGEEKALVSNDTKNGYDSYTSKQPSQDSSNSSSSTTSSNSSSNNNTSNSNNSSSNSDDKKEEIIDKSTFYGKDVIISEGQPFNPMNALQLYACDITGENITNSIVITENNVDIYKPGVYNVKASIALKNGKTLDKKFAVRVEPTVLDLAVNDVKTSKTELEKEENYTMNFAVNSSKSYIDVEKVVINKIEYEVEKVFEDESERYSVNLVASNKVGRDVLKLQKVIMSDKTVVDVDKAVNINVLKEDATLNDVIIKDESDENNAIGISFDLKDVDNTIKEPKICIYDEEHNLILEQKFSKSKYSPYTKVSTKVNLNKAGIYTVKILAHKNQEESEKYINEEGNVELFSKDIAVNMKEISDETDINILPLSLNDDNEQISAYSENEEASLKSRNARVSNKELNINNSNSSEHVISMIGNIADGSDQIKPGTIKVILPTSATFTVNKDGEFIAPSIQIKNEGQEAIDIYAYKFFDPNGELGINIKDEKYIRENQADIPRSNISLNITGIATAYFKSENSLEGKSGIYSDINLTKEATEGIKILKVYPESSNTLTLNGKAGKKTSDSDTAIRNTFKLILKIKRSTN